ncbi:hypothetical protein BDP81DRAFT_450828 [Colletotrichum phormii]|uniref:Uncharacterized protein n=1 Tax=Colletotrichum phormii TaxID=359342 RepID=A0AAI9ZQQ0_9PEZI|nr:uncharacterized protein BDP81DRAFT_450828 [Colletotrichum phormii]KAK1635069.1 hypothetical protein BDP81DRAFT_450828 [Colletotrichum phormii]
MSGQGRFIDPMESYLNPSPQCPIMARRIQEIHRAAHATNDSHRDHREHRDRAHHHHYHRSTRHRTPAHEADAYYPRSGPAPGPAIYVRFECVPHREVIACNDIWQTLGSATESYIGCNRTKGLWDTVFAGGWTTAHPVGDLPKPGPRDDDAVMVRCGVWRKDLPEISSESPKDFFHLTVTDYKSLSSEIDIGRLANHLKGASAYVKFTRGTHPLEARFTFCDSWGQDAPEDSIKYDGDGHISTHIYLARAAHLFDEHKRARLEKYNQELAVYIFRRRLQFWLSEGFLRTMATMGGVARGMEAQAASTVVLLPRDDEELRGKFEDFVGARASLEETR